MTYANCGLAWWRHIQKLGTSTQTLHQDDRQDSLVEENREIVEKLRKQGRHAVSGNASEPVTLIQAHIARASMLVIATPDTMLVRKMIDIARTLNPAVMTVIRTHSNEEAALLEQENAGKVFVGENELASGIVRYVLEKLDHRAVQHAQSNPG